MKKYWFRYKQTKDSNSLQVSVHANNHAGAYKEFDKKVGSQKVYEYELLDSVFEQMTRAV